MTQSQIEWLLIIILLSILGIWAAIPLPAIAADTTTYQVATAHDDAYEYQNSGFVSWLMDGFQVDGGTYAAVRYAVGVPTGTTAATATIKFTALTDTVICSDMPIRLEAADNAADYENGDTIWNRTYTTNAIIATVPPLADGQSWTSPNIASLVNQIISRPGWIPGQYIAIVLGPCALDTDITELHSYDTNPDAAPQLTIDWQEPTGIELSGYGINLPSGRVATVSRLITAGDQLITQLLIAIAAILTFRLILRIIDGSRASS